MSLKTVHLFFVTLLSALCFGLAAWRTRDYLAAGVVADLWFAIGAFLCGGVVVWYGTKVYKKLKSISYF